MGDIDRIGRTVVGLFPDRTHAEAAIRELKASGFGDERVGLAMQDRAGRSELALETGTHAAEGAAKGAVSGGVVGGLIGLLGSLLIPGIGPVVVGGVLASVLAGTGIGAATGGVIGALMGIGLPEDHARHFDLGLRSGGVLVAVDAGTRTGEALTILDRHEVDLGPGGRGLYEATEWSARDDTTAVTTPGPEYTGRERRRAHDLSYPGPERRLIGV